MDMNKKSIFKLLLIFICLFVLNNVYASNEIVAENFCTDASNTLKLVGMFIVVVKIAVPILVIIMATMDFFKIVMSGKDSDFKKEAIILGKRFLMGVIVFMLPSIINLAVNSFDSNPNADYKVCVDCLTKPGSCPVKEPSITSNSGNNTTKPNNQGGIDYNGESHSGSNGKF